MRRRRRLRRELRDTAARVGEELKTSAAVVRFDGLSPLPAGFWLEKEGGERAFRAEDLVTAIG